MSQKHSKIFIPEFDMFHFPFHFSQFAFAAGGKTNTNVFAMMQNEGFRGFRYFCAENQFYYQLIITNLIKSL